MNGRTRISTLIQNQHSQEYQGRKGHNGNGRLREIEHICSGQSGGEDALSPSGVSKVGDALCEVGRIATS